MTNKESISIGTSRIIKEIKLWEDMEANKSSQNYIKYATSKKASLKRKKKAGKRK